MIAENRGSSYWLTNKTPLPENFQLKIECYVLPVLPRRDGHRFGPPGLRLPQPVLPQQPANLNMLRVRCTSASAQTSSATTSFR